MIKSFIIDDHLGGDQNFQLRSSAYRANVQESKGMTPNLIIISKGCSSTLDLIYQEDSCRTKCWPIKGKQLGLQLAKAHRIARNHLSNASVRQPVHYNPRNEEQ